MRNAKRAGTAPAGGGRTGGEVRVAAEVEEADVLGRQEHLVVGFGRVAAPETEAPIILANMV